jgi:hypothetical protein
VLAAGNVHFVDIDIVDGCASDGRVETGEELLDALILAAAEHGNGLATICSDRHGAHWFHGNDCDGPCVRLRCCASGIREEQARLIWNER